MESKMNGVARFTVSLDPELLQAFDGLVKREGFPTRSEAVQQLMRKALVEKAWESHGTVAGAMVMVYDHHRHDLIQKLMDIQHDYGQIIISVQHVHLDHDNCLEVVTLKGQATAIRDLEGALNSVKGMKHSSLVMTTTGGEIR